MASAVEPGRAEVQHLQSEDTSGWTHRAMKPPRSLQIPVQWTLAGFLALGSGLAEGIAE